VRHERFESDHLLGDQNHDRALEALVVLAMVERQAHPEDLGGERVDAVVVELLA
jgi:hypothetical protein